MALAAFALVPSNLLLLDEASNHLDAQTIEVLTGALQVSHTTPKPSRSCLELMEFPRNALQLMPHDINQGSQPSKFLCM